MKNKSVQDAFLFFSQKILKGNEGAFFLLDRPKIDKELIWVMGYGQKKSVKFDTNIFPIFTTIDFLGNEKNIWYFEYNYSSTDENNKLFNDKVLNNKVAQELVCMQKIVLDKPLYSYASETKNSFENKVKDLQKFQKDGNAWVINLTQNIFGDLDELQKSKKGRALLLSSYFDFLKTGESHCGGIVITNEQEFCSFSPEVFCKQEKQNISTYPIKGTGPKDLLLKSEKEISELNMITDLLRNDFGQICSKVEVKQERVLTAEKDFHHAHSVITGVLAPKREQRYLTWDQFKKLLPAGSVSGAPKNKVVEKILELENFDRKFYTGTFGVKISPELSIFNVLIRTLFLGKKYWYFPVGAGITVESDPVAEFVETFEKAKVFERFCIQGGRSPHSSE